MSVGRRDGQCSSVPMRFSGFARGADVGASVPTTDEWPPEHGTTRRQIILQIILLQRRRAADYRQNVQRRRCALVSTVAASPEQ